MSIDYKIDVPECHPYTYILEQQRIDEEEEKKCPVVEGPETFAQYLTRTAIELDRIEENHREWVESLMGYQEEFASSSECETSTDPSDDPEWVPSNDEE